jgi:ATP-binding cassette subfamily B protein
MVFRPLADLAERYNVLQSAMAAAEKIFEVLDTSIEEEGAQPGAELNSIDSIEFQDVWFAYEEEHYVLKGLSFKVNKGESIALVGMTGSGKTTILNVLLRFYPFQKGMIRINGQDIHQYAVQDLRRCFSVILQDPVIFSGTIEDNISLYDASIGSEEVRASAEFVNLSPFVDELPQKYKQPLKERGIGLSAGEMQLIALARAVAHERSVLIMDEATSNIDVLTEKIIQDSLKKILKEQTALVIAHRLTTIQDVRRIFVLSQGRVVEQGSHEELLNAKGIYSNIYCLQFSN